LAQGKGGAGLAKAIAGLADGAAELKDIEASLLMNTSDPKAYAAQVAASFDPKAVAAAIRAKYGTGTASEYVIKEMFEGDIKTEDAMKQLGIQVTDLVGEAAKENPTELTAKWGPMVADNLRKELVDGLNSKSITLTATEGTKGPDDYRKDGGFIRKFRDGGLLRLAPGGRVPGVGGPRADNIPAMLSVDEFVVNAAAARRNEKLLTAINSGNASDLMADAVSAASGGGGTNIQITVNAVPNESVNELVSEVERRLAFSYRKGVSV
jgi:hypothetical protein